MHLLTVRKARASLLTQFKQAKRGNEFAKIVYPAKLVVGNVVAKDMFPNWGRFKVDEGSLEVPTKAQHEPSTTQPAKVASSIPLSRLQKDHHTSEVIAHRTYDRANTLVVNTPHHIQSVASAHVMTENSHNTTAPVTQGPISNIKYNYSPDIARPRPRPSQSIVTRPCPSPRTSHSTISSSRPGQNICQNHYPDYSAGYSDTLQSKSMQGQAEFLCPTRSNPWINDSDILPQDYWHREWHDDEYH